MKPNAALTLLKKGNDERLREARGGVMFLKIAVVQFAINQFAPEKNLKLLVF